MAKKKAGQVAETYVRHRKDAEWLTADICNYYRGQAERIKNHNISDPVFYKLCRELVDRCDVTELQAINILNGFHTNDYVNIYEHIRDPDSGNRKDDERREYLEWLAEKEDRDSGLDEYSLLDDD